MGWEDKEMTEEIFILTLKAKDGRAELTREIPLGIYGELVQKYFPDFAKLMR